MTELINAIQWASFIIGGSIIILAVSVYGILEKIHNTLDEIRYNLPGKQGTLDNEQN